MQTELALRQAIFDAVTPAELEAVLDELRLSTATRRIGGNAPTHLKAVVSLREQLLQLEDRTEWPSGYYPLSSAERLQQLIRSPRFGVYGIDGTYLGQRIPFSLAPLGTFGLGDAQGFTLLTGSDCAERL